MFARQALARYRRPAGEARLGWADGCELVDWPAVEEPMMGEVAFVVSVVDDGLRERLSEEVNAFNVAATPTPGCCASPSVGRR
jgi:hypothetical protein